MSFWCLQFPPKNEQKPVNLRFHSSKVEFIFSFFWRNVGLKKSFWLCLTFRWRKALYSTIKVILLLAVTGRIWAKEGQKSKQGEAKDCHQKNLKTRRRTLYINTNTHRQFPYLHSFLWFPPPCLASFDPFTFISDKALMIVLCGTI